MENQELSTDLIKKKWTAKDIENMSREEIDEKIQKPLNEANLAAIEKALAAGEIDDDSAEYLRDMYADGMETYRVLCRQINLAVSSMRYKHEKNIPEDFKPQYPEEANAINLDTGEVEQVFDEKHGRMVDKKYKITQITPFTSMRLTYYDWRNNPIYVILPGLKSVDRAIEKVRKDGKYYKQYLKDIEQAKAESNGNEELYQKKIKNILKPHERLKDIFRFTVSRKYYEDTEDSVDRFLYLKNECIKTEYVKDMFCNNDMENIETLEKNKKNYYDKKISLSWEMNGRKVTAEGQMKITRLYDADIDTHRIYEQLRQEEERSHNLVTWGDKLVSKLKIHKYKLAIQYRNKKAMRDYNIQVLDRVYRVEDNAIGFGSKYDSSLVDTKSGKLVSTFHECEKFIKKNFLVRPFKAFDLLNAFPVTKEYLRENNFLVNETSLLDVANRYRSLIMPKYRKRIYGNEAVEFNNPQNQQKITKEFSQYGYNESQKFLTQPSSDEKEMLEDLNISNISLAKEKVSKHNDSNMMSLYVGKNINAAR